MSDGGVSPPASYVNAVDHWRKSGQSKNIVESGRVHTGGVGLHLSDDILTEYFLGPRGCYIFLNNIFNLKETTAR